jgi:hypothetical protein
MAAVKDAGACKPQNQKSRRCEAVSIGDAIGKEKRRAGDA